MGRMDLIMQQSVTSIPLCAGVTQILVAQAYGIALDEIRATSRRNSEAAFARQIAMYLAHVVFSLSIGDVAKAFARDRSTVCHAIQRVEALREDPDLDSTLGWLETLLRAIAERL
ncbi:MAG TPA: helix-turn-helix domain-containing protein [Rhizomicrobium sp.]|nr:helix-turn-helix domain-containing protein [Rhizomicrobium sp.]